MINPLITLNKNYVVFDIKSEINKNNFKKMSKLIKKMEKANVVLTKELINGLLSLSDEDYSQVHDSLMTKFKPLKGDIFRSTFATGSDISDEKFTFEDFVNQLTHYFISYGLEEIHIPEKDKNRKINVDNVSKRKEKQELNKNLKIIELKSVSAFAQDIKEMIYLPIVYGEMQVEFIKEYATNFNINDLIDEPIKVKENLFTLAYYKEVDIVKLIKTPTDLLRWVYFFNEYNYKELPLKDVYSEKTLKFKLKSSEKTKIMKILNNLFKRNPLSVYSEMYTKKSHWIAISKALYPRSKKYNKYSYAQEVFDMLRNKEKHVETFNGTSARLIRESKYLELAKHLSFNSGLLMRNLDMIIRNLKKGEIKELVKIINNELKLNSKLILQIKSWLSYRKSKDLENRTFNVKGKAVSTDKSLKKLKEKRTNKIIKVLKSKLKSNLKGKELW